MNLSSIDMPFLVVVLVALIFIIIFIKKLMPYYFTREGRKKLLKANEKDMTPLFIGVLEVTLIIIILLGIFLSIKPLINLLYGYNLNLLFILALILVYGIIIYLLYLLIRKIDKKYGEV